jgi:5-(carboxyamino)imidazole ribonucleotide mutase
MVEVGIIMGSQSDLEKMKKAREALESFGIDSEMIVASAHRTPERVRQWVQTARGAGTAGHYRGCGMAAHLAGVVASADGPAVIGVPCSGGSARRRRCSLCHWSICPRGLRATVAIDRGL